MPSGKNPIKISLLFSKLIDDSKVPTMNEKQKFWEENEESLERYSVFIENKEFRRPEFGFLNKLKGLALILSFRFISVFQYPSNALSGILLEHLFNLFGSGDLLSDNNVQQLKETMCQLQVIIQG